MCHFSLANLKLLFIVPLLGLAACLPRTKVPPQGAVLKDVTIVNPGLNERSHQTIVIRGGRIESISDTPADRIDSRRVRYALPGLIDMHAHHPLASGLAAISGDARLFDILFLAHGVTTVRDTGSMDGKIFDIRRSIQRGKQPGPRVFACGAIIDGDPPGWPGAVAVHNADEARRAADAQAHAGADCLKVYDSLSADALAAIRDEANKRHLPVIGHLPRAVTFEQAHLADVQHLTGVAQIPRGDPIGGLVKAWSELSDARMDFIVRVSREQGIQHTPTMDVPKRLFQVLTAMQSSDYDSSILLRFPEVGALPRYYRDALWKPGFLLPAQFPPEVIANAPRALNNLDRMVRRLHEGGVRLHVGTDTPNPYLVPGASLWSELQNFVEVGFTPAQAWAAATREAGEDLKAPGLGTLEPGAPADIAVFRHDPSVDLKALGTLETVIADGRPYSKSELDDAASRYRRRFENPVYAWVTMTAFELIAATFRPRQRLFAH